MSRKIIGVTVGTPMNPKKFASPSDEQVQNSVNEYLENNPIEQVTDAQIAQAVEKHLAEHPIDGADGKDGYTPQKGIDYFDGEDGKDGQNGADGYSPTISVSKSGKVTTITITDKSGTKTATINDGADGQDGSDGNNGQDGKDGSDATVTTESIKTALGYTPANQIDVRQLSEEIGDLNKSKQPVGDYAYRAEIPTVPVKSVNGKTGAVALSASDVGATTESWVQAKLDDLKAQGVQQTPLFAESVEDMTDTTKIYVLPNGDMYGYMKTVTEGETVPNFTNLMDNPNAYIKDEQRYSHSGGAFKECTTDCAIVIPILSTSGAFTLRIRGANLKTSAYQTSAYFGANNQVFGGSNDIINMSYTTESNGDLTFVQKAYNGGYNYIVIHVSSGVNKDNLIVTLNEEITYTTTEGVLAYKWASTGHAFVPADYEGRIVEAETKLNKHDNRLDNLERNQTTGLSLEHNSCSIFRKVVCCGDSFTAGYIGTNNDNIVQTNWDYAWPSFMARLTGNEYVNCGHSGKDVLTWQTSSKGLPRAQAAGKAQAYLIGLGLNDVGTVSLGVISDIGTENQTYYGGLSKIIRELNTISPTAKIFVQTMPKDSDTYLQYNEAIRNVVNAYKDTYSVHLLDLYAYRDMYKTTKVTGDAIMGHHTAIGYQQFAENLRYIWSDYINKNISEFQDVYLIPYDETPSNL